MRWKRPAVRLHIACSCVHNLACTPDMQLKRLRGLPQNFNAMMFHQFRPDARIVHMNG